ncbi:MAG: NACHT domain-containing protein [Candidatus Thiodiazotropha sp. (ex Monitilora ramsayi)]|nr:NACHT domain-containing protein [Candidatus Thiodiazotropha sp. (ex Monitilora ramsayi)]
MTDLIVNSCSISRFKKEKFLKEMSEDSFRDELIRPLLLRIGYQDGRDFCGPTEYGKDAVFSEVNRLDQKEYVAIQTKKGNLTLSSKASQNVVSAITQLNTALAQPIPLLKEKKRIFPSKVILCTSGKINDAARSHIVSEVKDTRIHFLDSDEIIPLTDEHYPEFWLGIDVELMPYLRALKNLVEVDQGNEEETLRISPFLSKAAADSDYVELGLYHHKIKIEKFRGKIYKTQEIDEFSLQDIIHKKINPSLILGEAGFGKSTSLLRLAYITAKSSVESSYDYIIPIIVKANDYITSEFETLINFSDHITRKLANTDNACFSPNNLEKGQVLFLIDAIDEIASAEKRSQLISEIKALHNKYPKNKIILTSRPYKNILAIKELEGFHRVHIHPLSLKQAEKIIKCVQSKKHELPKEQSKELLRRIDQVHGIELSPLLITVFAATSDLSRKDIPANITELFKKFTELMLGRWDEEKGLSQQYHAPLKDFLLTKIAFTLHSDRQTKLSLSRLKDLITNELSIRGHSGDNEIITNELIYRSGLFRILDNEIEFRHHLLQEFFAGRGIDNNDFVAEIIDDDWWRNCIVFYFGDNPDDINNLLDITTTYKPRSSAYLMQAAITIGIALQASYLSPVDEKIDVWKWVVCALSSSEDGSLKALSDTGSKTPITDFVMYYLSGRDAVALHNLEDFSEAILKWSENYSELESHSSDAHSFWLTVALIEIGRLDLAFNILKANSISNTNYLLACHLGSFLSKEIRIVSDSQRKYADKIINLLDVKVGHLKQNLLDELGSQLLEVRNQEVKVLEHTKNGVGDK